MMTRGRAAANKDLPHGGPGSKGAALPSSPKPAPPERIKRHRRLNRGCAILVPQEQEPPSPRGQILRRDGRVPVRSGRNSILHLLLLKHPSKREEVPPPAPAGSLRPLQQEPEAARIGTRLAQKGRDLPRPGRKRPSNPPLPQPRSKAAGPLRLPLRRELAAEPFPTRPCGRGTEAPARPGESNSAALLPGKWFKKTARPKSTPA